MLVYMNPSSNSSFGGGAQPVSGGAVGFGGASSGNGAVGSGGVISSGVVSPGVGGAQQMQQPISSGTGDIVLSSGGGQERKSKKLFVIVGAVAVVAVIVVLVIVFLNRGSSSGGVRVSNAREAFNVYANYFLTGETSKDDIEGTEDVELEAESEGESAVEYVPVGDEVVEGEIEYMEEVPLDENGEEVEIIEMVTEEGEDSETTSAYFDDVYTGMAEDASKDYFENLRRYYGVFGEMYEKEVGDGDGMEMVNDYGEKLNLATIYYGGASLSQAAILEAYDAGGNDEAGQLIDETAALYNDFATIYQEDLSELMTNYGRGELKLLLAYIGYGCVVGSTIDYECVSANMTEEDEAVMSMTAEYATIIQDVMERCVDELYSGIYDIRALVYEEE